VATRCGAAERTLGRRQVTVTYVMIHPKTGSIEMRIDIGAGEHPSPDCDVTVDVLALPGITHVVPMDRLPFPDQTFEGLRANDVLEHQSWELIDATLREWARVLKPGGEAYVQVPNARSLAERWVCGALATREANYWLLGGHSDRAAHRGADSNGVPRWIWNAHHTLFDEASLRAGLQHAGFVDIRIQSDGGSNLMCWCRRG
jgi:SAM-dependent methyltransferase